MEVTGNPGGTGLLWTAMLTTLFVISRALTRRPLRGQRSDVENLTLLLAIAGDDCDPGRLRLHHRRRHLRRGAATWRPRSRSPVVSSLVWRQARIA